MKSNKDEEEYYNFIAKYLANKKTDVSPYSLSSTIIPKTGKTLNHELTDNDGRNFSKSFVDNKNPYWIGSLASEFPALFLKL